MYERRNLKNESFDDNDVKNKILEISKDLLGFETKINNEDDGKGIDLVAVHDELIGIEVERGGFVHDLWEDKQYGWLSGFEHPTVNIPDRKIKYWMEYYDFFQNGNITYNPSYDKNIFVRTNFFFTQFIVIRPETIRDSNKAIYKRFKASNNSKEEGWLTFRKNYVETYNIIDGKIVLETEFNGKLPKIKVKDKKLLTHKKMYIKEELKNKQNKYRHV